MSLHGGEISKRLLVNAFGRTDTVIPEDDGTVTIAVGEATRHRRHCPMKRIADQTKTPLR